MEIFSNIESQIERAVQMGEDKIVQALDREIHPVLEDILLYRAKTTTELHKQLKFITDLLARRSDDAAAVALLSSKLSEIISRYFEGGDLRLREGKDTPGYAITLLSPAPDPIDHEALAIARVAVLSMDYRFLYCNAVMSEDLAHSPRQLVGRSIADVCNMAIFDSAYRGHVDMCFAGAFREFTAPRLTGGLDQPDYTVRLTPLRNIERRITGAVMVAQSSVPAPVAVEH